MIGYFNILIQLSILRCLLNIIKVDTSYFIEKVLYCLESQFALLVKEEKSI